MIEKTTVSQRWEKEDADRGDIIERCVKYALYTIPHVFPRTGTADTEQSNSMNGIGAESVNFLANKLTTTLFTPQSPYFRILIEQAMLEEIIKTKGMDKGAIETATAAGEKNTVRKQENKKALRASATLGSKLLVITGNVLMYYNEKDEPIQAFSLRDYVCKRNASGKALKMITREAMDYSELSQNAMDQLSEQFRNEKEQLIKEGGDAPVTLYTEIRRKIDGVRMTDRWETQQAVDDQDLDPSGDYPSEKLPWVPLVWHLNKGDHYGRGLVEDYAGDFHALTILSESLVRGLAVLADIKFLVRPGATVKIKEFTRSKTGSYHYGKEGDITSPQFNKGADFQILNEAIDKYERRISRAFLNGSSSRRQAERVTAEEIRQDATDLDVQGGLYSRLVQDWQRPWAILGLADIDFSLGKEFDVEIVSGMDTMSRSGEMDQFRWFLDDLAALQGLPEEVLAAFDMPDTIAFVAANRSVPYTKFAKTKKEHLADVARKENQARQDNLIAEEAKTAGAMAVAEQAQRGGA